MLITADGIKPLAQSVAACFMPLARILRSQSTVTQRVQLDLMIACAQLVTCIPLMCAYPTRHPSSALVAGFYHVSSTRNTES